MSAGHSSGPKIKPIYIIILIVVVFALSIYGHHHHMGKDFNIWGVIYATILYFFMHHVSPVSEGLAIGLAQYLALILILAGIFSFVYKNIHKAFLLASIKRNYKGHVVVFSLSKLGKNIANELLKNGYKVIIVDTHTDNHYAEPLQKKGAIVFTEHSIDKKVFGNANLGHAATCILADEDDNVNIGLASSITSYRKDNGDGSALKIMTHVQNNDNVDILKDYFDINNEDEHYDLETFNVSQMAAARIYDQYPLHEYLVEGEKDSEKALVIVGYTATTEKFLVENIVLSHFPELENIKIYLVDENAETHFHEFEFKYPFFREFVDIIPVKLRNATFFANFSWSKDVIEKLSRAKAAYIFGDNDSALINRATSFRQFLYSQTRSTTSVPILVCLPEDTGVLDLLNSTGGERAGGVTRTFSANLNINYFRLVSDTCTAQALIEQKALTDRQAKLVHYFYTIKYGFADILQQKMNVANAGQMTAKLADMMLALPEQHAKVDEVMIEQMVFSQLSQQTSVSVDTLKHHLSIEKVWNQLSSRKKDSNRYVARHVPAKVFALRRIGCWPLNKENISRYYPRLAPLEHKRWSAEKMIFNFKYGPYPENKEEKYLLKEVLKIHDQIIPYDRLTEEEKQKDLNIFLLLPLLNALN
ncbi:MAG: hypothetical protein EOP56_06930 [Sphingobacteriales bacterium]|nr:MAG: hypothetical protein EOP56_06930 [Sphingobacteriales bacterium]